MIVLWVSVCPAAGQAVQGPSGASGGLFGGHRPADPNRVSQRLSLTVDLSGGYDSRGDNPVASAQSGFEPLYAGTASTSARYWRGKPARFLEASANGRVNYETRTREQLIGGQGLLLGSTSVGRKLQLTGGTLFSYDPAALSSQFAPGLGQQETEFGVDHSTPIGIREQPWLTGSAYVNALRTWSVRQTTVFEYRASRREPLDGLGLASRAQEAAMTHSWNFNRSASLRASYRFDDNRQATQTIVSQPLRTSTVDFGMHFDRRFSPIRVLSLDIAGGAARANRAAAVDMSGLDYVLPVVSGSVRFNLTGIWSLILEGSRDINVLEGVSPEPFATNVGTLRLNANLSSRMAFAVSGTHSKGAGVETSSHGFETAQANAQLQFGFGRCCGTFGSYSFYQHHTRDLATLAANFPERYSQHTVRLGLTFWLPLYGSF